MKKIMQMLVFFALAGVTVAAYGEEKARKDWSGQAEFSLVDASGNTQATTLSFKNELKYAFNPKMNGSWKIGVLYSESDDKISAESYSTELKLDYLVDSRTYGYGSLAWLKDRFAGLDPRYMVGGGLGYKFLTGPAHSLSGEAGLGYTHDSYVDGTDADYLNGRAFGKYIYALTAKNTFSQSLEYIQDFSRSQNFSIISETALIVALTDILSMKASYTVRYANSPTPDTLKNTDRLLRISLVANF